MLLLMLALNRTCTDWHDNSPCNSPPPLAVTLSLVPSPLSSSHPIIKSHPSYSTHPLSLLSSLIPPPSSSLALSRYMYLSYPRRDSPDGPLAPPPPLICSDPCSFSRRKKVSPSKGPAAGTIHALWADAIGPSSGVCSMQHAPDMRPGSRPLCGDSENSTARPTVLSLHFLD